MNARAMGFAGLAAVVHCAPPSAATPIRPMVTAPATSSGGDAPPAARAALDALQRAMARGDAPALAVLGLAIEPAGRARDITGEPAADEQVERATVLARGDDSAALVVETTCGNATLGAVRWDGARWQAGDRVALTTDLHPGRCAATDVHTEALALTTDASRDVAVVLVSQDATGESVRGPFLSVYTLAAGGHLVPRLVEAPFGEMDDATGATTTGHYDVIPDVPPPRDLHVSIRPGRPGPGGPAPSDIVRRRYTLRGARYELVNESRELAE